MAPPRGAELLRRLARLLPGLVLFGVGIGLMAVASLGLPAWDVFHEGIADQFGTTLGVIGIVVSVVVLLAFVPLREPFGLGTLANAVVIGLVVDLTIAFVDEPSSLAMRIVLCGVGPALVGLGSGFYIGALLGPGPRDGLMTAMAARGVTVWKARAAIEVLVLVVGVVLGGTVGWGTLWFTVSIGPFVQLFLRAPIALPEALDRADDAGRSAATAPGGSPLE